RPTRSRTSRSIASVTSCATTSAIWWRQPPAVSSGDRVLVDRVLAVEAGSHVGFGIPDRVVVGGVFLVEDRAVDRVRAGLGRERGGGRLGRGRRGDGRDRRGNGRRWHRARRGGRARGGGH